ncbi:hypothetical protein EOA32_06055 [Mesorhizobium sp. M1A.F.Ca.ET.072.01.1.1]|uniref:hypothetical protein n=1 Tax=Mesorhizobium sp. M1A.F.Ca.ET.072.01.1.1 TaxID=2496753 RepID=UPI000FD3D066|nr:hypothetical protein [Mesorhizobium sp. M1A.F.Ca.ET.072.01.1.1]RUW54340.1 hypothetical protein EOA32_06055 [Mesorhizobium sp. M1A.F.Ca.ET.072.01.1.1]TIU96241.1 MAG: hypothetical protein E5W04_28970 [Mesorhizobium sp.]
MAAPAVNMLWIGDRLGRVELLSIASWLACGHAVRLHVYKPVANVPAEVDVIDAELTVPFTSMSVYAIGRPALMRSPPTISAIGFS